MKHVRRIVCVAIIAIMMAGLMACSAPVQESQAPAAGASETVSKAAAQDSRLSLRHLTAR